MSDIWEVLLKEHGRAITYLTILDLVQRKKLQIEEAELLLDKLGLRDAGYTMPEFRSAVVH